MNVERDNLKMYFNNAWIQHTMFNENRPEMVILNKMTQNDKKQFNFKLNLKESLRSRNYGM
jgi:hypothetical protein